MNNLQTAVAAYMYQKVGFVPSLLPGQESHSERMIRECMRNVTRCNTSKKLKYCLAR